MAKNNYFKFKKFTIFQENIGLKVSTEACIFGAFLPCENATKILDIGTGTGLLALMSAQKTHENHLKNNTEIQTEIHAIDIAEIAYLQAKENIEKSIFKEIFKRDFKDNLQVFWESLQDFSERFFANEIPQTKYDFILSNPPFFKNHIPTQNLLKQHAKHTQTLDFEDLALHTTRLLTNNGVFWVILPPLEMQTFTEIAKKYKLFLYEKIQIFQFETPEIYPKEIQKVFREIAGFSFNLLESQEQIKQKEIAQENTENPPKSFCIYEKNIDLKTGKYKYTQSFSTLLADFYLYL